MFLFFLFDVGRFFQLLVSRLEYNQKTSLTCLLVVFVYLELRLCLWDNALNRTWTYNPQIRNLMLYPVELWAQMIQYSFIHSWIQWTRILERFQHPWLNSFRTQDNHSFPRQVPCCHVWNLDRKYRIPYKTRQLLCNHFLLLCEFSQSHNLFFYLTALIPSIQLVVRCF